MTTENLEQVALRVKMIAWAQELGLETSKMAVFIHRVIKELGVSVSAETGRIEPVAYLMRDKIERNPLHRFIGPETVDWRLPLYLSPPLPTKERWQWVPVEPTDEMLEAAMDYWNSHSASTAEKMWREMLDAAPKP